MRKILFVVMLSVIYLHAAADMAIDTVIPTLSGWVSDTLADTLSQFTVVVKNVGNRRARNVSTFYRVDSGGVTIVGPTKIHKDNFTAGQQRIYTFTWNPSIYHMAAYDLYVYDDYSGGNTSDDTVAMHFRIKGHQGKDAYGWVWRDSYSLLGAPGGTRWIELNGDPDAQDLYLGDDDTAHVALAHGIKFYGHNYDSIWVCSNGILSFNKQPGYWYDNDSIPSSSINDARLLMPFWDDLDPGSGGAVYYKTFSDTLTVIEWYQVLAYSLGGTDSTFTFEVQIQSNLASTGVYDNITFVYNNMQYDSSSMDATIGIQDSGAVNGYLYFTYNEQPYTPNWTNTKGVFAIKFYSPEALGINENQEVLPIKRHSIIAHGIYSLYLSPNEDIYVRDITGRLVKVRKWRDGKRVYIDLSRLKRGIYYIEDAKKGNFTRVINVR